MSAETVSSLPILPEPDSIRPVSLVVRPMRGSDIEQVAQIERLSCAIPWSAQAYVTEISNPAAAYFVAASGDYVLGYGGIWTVMDECHVTTLAVHPEQRGRKIGERILSCLLEKAQKTGAIRATLEVRIGNDPARHLYEKYGFVWAAIRKKYYADNQEDAVVMWIHDLKRPEWQEQFVQNRALLSSLTD